MNDEAGFTDFFTEIMQINSSYLKIETVKIVSLTFLGHCIHDWHLLTIRYCDICCG